MTHMNDSTSWPLTVQVSSGFLLRSAIIAVLCLVLGLWGIYDYLVKLPTQELLYHRAEVARQFNRIAEPILNTSDEAPDSDATVDDEALAGFRDAIIADLRIEPAAKLADEVNGLQQVATDDTGASISLNEIGRLLAQHLKTVDTRLTQSEKVNTSWLAIVGVMTKVAQTPVGLNGKPVEELKMMRSAANQALNDWGDVQPPSKFDRPMQWLFILCLPFVPWYAWAAITARKRKYVLDQDGTLHMPGGTWSRDDIAEIDMSLWMRKSKAWVVHVDGHRALLDDYVFKGLHRIIGVLAHAQDSDQWTMDAKRVKADAPAATTDKKLRPEETIEADKAEATDADTTKMASEPDLDKVD